MKRENIKSSKIVQIDLEGSKINYSEEYIDPCDDKILDSVDKKTPELFDAWEEPNADESLSPGKQKRLLLEEWRDIIAKNAVLKHRHSKQFHLLNQERIDVATIELKEKLEEYEIKLNQNNFKFTVEYVKENPKLYTLLFKFYEHVQDTIIYPEHDIVSPNHIKGKKLFYEWVYDLIGKKEKQTKEKALNAIKQQFNVICPQYVNSRDNPKKKV